ncbi:type VI secretion system-associated protein TagF [Bacillus subtilis subsp. subtilis]|nr:type VI secretion system-associated protein TagF [Bacillus subtilis subsp. subtilis]
MIPPVPDVQAAAGFYGKLRVAGDFVRRRLPDAFVDPWDAHASALLAGHAAPQRAAWDAAIERRCSWAFVLAPGVCGPGAWCGVVAPLQDRVGRRFPMVIAQPTAMPVAWFQAAATLLADAQAGALATLDAFDAGCRGLPAAHATPWPVLPAGSSRWWRGAVDATAGALYAGLPDPLACVAALQCTAPSPEAAP